jgi:hypothetical protein
MRRRAPLVTLALLARASAAFADDVPIEEVRVLAPHRELGGTTVRREDTRNLAGALGDPTRIVEALPGVVPTTSGLQAFFVRGAPPTATGSFIDGVPVPALYHLGFGPSVIHPALIDRAEFFQGAPPARYGRFVGGVVSATTAIPQDHAHGEANVRLFDVGGLAESPIADGHGSALAAVRYGYPGLVVPLFAPDVGLSYWDYQGRVTWSPSGRDRLGAFVFGSYDLLTQRPGIDRRSLRVADQFHRADLRWDRDLGGQAAMRVAATLGRDLVGNDNVNATDDIARLRAEVDARPSSVLRVRGGADVQIDQLRRAAPPPGAIAQEFMPLSPSRDDVVAGAYLDVGWNLTPEVEVVPGLRADVFTTRPVPAAAGHDASTTPAVDPRLAVRARLAPSVTLVSTFGVSHQRPGLFVPVPDVTPLLQPGTQEEIQTSVQTSQGVELALPENFFVSSTVFLHNYFGLPDVTAPCVDGPSLGSCGVLPSGVHGRALGAELLVRRPFTERFTMWISYTLSRSTRDARAGFRSTPTMTIPSEYDRTHVLSAAASYDLGRRWRAGARVFAYSGRPYTQTLFNIPVVPYNSARLLSRRRSSREGVGPRGRRPDRPRLRGTERDAQQRGHFGQVRAVGPHCPSRDGRPVHHRASRADHDPERRRRGHLPLASEHGRAAHVAAREPLEGHVRIA